MIIAYMDSMQMGKARQPNKLTLFAILWWTLVACVGITVHGIVWETLAPAYWPHLPDGRADSLPDLLIGLGILLALMTFRRDTTNQRAENQLKSDQLAFEVARDGLRQAAALLKDLNNDRENWVNAACLLLKAQDLAQGIHTGVVGKAIQIELAKTRYELVNLLQCNTRDGLSKQCLPPSFFLGTSGWESVEDGTEALMEAYGESDFSTTVGWLGLNVINEQPMLKNLTPASVVAVYDFIFSDSWADDPLKQVELWEDGEMDIRPGFDQGARQYIYLRNHYFVAGGQVHEFNPPSDVSSE